MTVRDELWAALRRCRFVAILRGVKPSEVEAIGQVLVDAGFAMIEVPLNSPDPIDSIARLQKAFGDRALIGGGTMLDEAHVAQVAATGARLMIAPNTDPGVIVAAAAKSMIALPGYQTPSEAFTAIAAGATGLKLFPAEAATPAILKAHRAVLPRDIPVLAVGGIGPETVAAWDASADGYGLGSALYQPGDSTEDVHRKTSAFLTMADK